MEVNTLVKVIKMEVNTLVKVWRQEEEMRRELVHSVPYVYTETLMERADLIAFGKHPYGRYAAGAFCGLFIESIVRRR